MNDSSLYNKIFAACLSAALAHPEDAMKLSWFGKNLKALKRNEESQKAA